MHLKLHFPAARRQKKKRRRAVVDTYGLDFYPHDDAGRLIVRMLFTKEATSSKDERHFAKVGES